MFACTAKERARVSVFAYSEKEKAHMRVFACAAKEERSSKKGNASDCICLLIYALAVSAIFVPVFVIFNKYNIKNTLLFA